ncbi:MAG: SUMF1/EgtB/PvdO family nonheme iron enzyme, partial [Myxococcota bacterium]|nr:SUMF1/EgtB/PvdO family nonheme iron enzyme [Myxococcota bacterium]
PEIDDHLRRASELRDQATTHLAQVLPWQPEGDKVAAWTLQDEATELEQLARSKETEREQLMEGALVHEPDLPDAHRALAKLYRTVHQQLERSRSHSSGRVEGLLRRHAIALPDDDPDRQSHFAYLRGHGALTLHSDPPGAEVRLHRYEVRNRRLVTLFERSLGRTPIEEESIARGSYLLTLHHENRPTVRYPIHIGRLEHWDAVPPGATESLPVPLPSQEQVPAGACYVPGGWTRLGGDPRALNSLPLHRTWIDGFFIQQRPVTNREYLGFLERLLAQGQHELALRCAPRERPGSSQEEGALIYGLQGDRFTLRADADGDLWQPDWPVMMVDLYGALCFARERAKRSGNAWQLPGEHAWEKAARGTDGRFHPWGDHYDPSWACTRASHDGRPRPQSVDDFPVDESPFGVLGLGGNMQDWCLDPFHTQGRSHPGTRTPLSHGLEPDQLGEEPRVVRGGFWFGHEATARCAARTQFTPTARHFVISLRCLLPLDGIDQRP